ncbi:MAG: hypothetical protein HQL84_10585 [Magnetococcales bacterium]|nr:hypothetical protein [Magnetococcales bacterium]MBF0150478.1 hypothetical protein [Magnetococcales bacterium]MBF0349323.1 hypothetical protein [Magnetococcales bacterium]MBF0629485.1 hypothetical protein [Magnetococcales bacterium]
MTLAEEIYQRVQHLPEDKAAEVLDFIGDLEITMNRRLSIPKKRRPILEWLKPIHVSSWDDTIDLSREAMYDDDGC